MRRHRFHVQTIQWIFPVLFSLFASAWAETIGEYPVDIFRELRLRRYARDFREPVLRQWNTSEDTLGVSARGDFWFEGDVRPADGRHEDWVVSILDPYGNEIQRVRTKLGEFHVHGLYHAWYTVAVHRNSFGSPLGDLYYLGNTFHFNRATHVYKQEYVTITLPPGFYGEDIYVSGKLTCNEATIGSTPVEVVFIPVAHDDRRTFRLNGVCDQDGEFRLRTKIDFRRYRILLDVPGYAPRWWNRRYLFEKPPVLYVGGDLHRDEIRLDSAATIYGTVTRTGRSVNRPVEVRCVTSDGLIMARDSVAGDETSFVLGDLAEGTYYVVMDEGRTGKSYYPNVPEANAAASIPVRRGERYRVDLSSSRQTEFRDDYPKALVRGYIRMPGPYLAGTGPVTIEYCDTALAIRTRYEDSRFEIPVAANEPFLIRAGQTYYPWFLDKDLAYTRTLSEGETLSVLIDLQYGYYQKETVLLNDGTGPPKLVALNRIDGPIAREPEPKGYPFQGGRTGSITAVVPSRYEVAVFCYTEDRELYQIGLVQPPEWALGHAATILQKEYEIDWSIRLETTRLAKAKCRLTELPEGKYYIGKYEFREETGPIIEWFGAYRDTTHWDGVSLPKVPRRAVAVTVKRSTKTIVDFTTPPNRGALQGVLPTQLVRAERTHVHGHSGEERTYRFPASAATAVDIYSCRGRLLGTVESNSSAETNAASGNYLIRAENPRRRVRLPHR